jgi:hypothetical protein
MNTSKMIVYLIFGALAASVVSIYSYNTRPVERTAFVPPTATPAPALIETLSTPPPFERYPIGVVVEHLQQRRLEFVNPQPMTVDDYGMAPRVATAAMRFLIPSLCKDCGGRIFTFATAEDLELTQSYYVELGKSSAAYYSHTFAQANILLQINGDLPDEKAEQYRQALYSLP